MSKDLLRGLFLSVLLILLLPTVACQESDQNKTPEASAGQTRDANGGETLPGSTARATNASELSMVSPVPLTEEATIAPTGLPASPQPLASATAGAAYPEPGGTAQQEETPSPPATPTPSGVPAASISLTLYADGFLLPTYLTHAFDDRLFVLEQAGRIWVISGGQKAAEPFLDISQRVGSSALEQGLLGLAFHPGFSGNGHFYVNYTDRNGDTVVARYSLSDQNPDRGDADSEQVLLVVDQPYGNHNGGQMQFGPDGFLYVGLGDGGSAGDPGNNGQDGTTLLGAILRIDVDDAEGYSIPSDNPYVSVGIGRDEIWAIGLRNPWRFSFDRLTGDLFIADVGQNQWEEINFQPAGLGGLNYGWNIMEGTHCYLDAACDASGFEMPVAEYSHAEGGCSVTGGYIYRGQDHPLLLGNYFFGDYCSGLIWSLFQLPDGTWQKSQVAQLSGTISSFGEDAAGELYVLNHGNGSVFKIAP